MSTRATVVISVAEESSSLAEENAAIVGEVALQLRVRSVLVAESLEQAFFERLEASVLDGSLAPERAYALERRLLAGLLLPRRLEA